MEHGYNPILRPRNCSQVTSVADVPPPIIQIGPTNQTLPLGGAALLPCRAIGTPAPRVKWYKDGMPLTVGPQRVVVAQIGSLKIDSTCVRGYFLFGVGCGIVLGSHSFHSFCRNSVGPTGCGGVLLFVRAQICSYRTPDCTRALRRRRAAKRRGRHR